MELREILETCRSLDKLALVDCAAISHNSFIKVLPLQNLRKLDVKDVSGFDDDCLHGIAKMCPLLEDFTFGYTGLTPIGMSSFLDLATNVKSLNLSRCCRISPSEMEVILNKKPPHLTITHTAQTADKHRTVETRLAVVRALRSSTAAEVCRTFKVSRRTLFRWKARWEQTRDLQPVKNKGTPFKLNPEEQRNLLVEFDKCPGLTNSQAAALLDHRINHRTVSDYLKRCGYSRKLFSDEQEKYANEDVIQLVRDYTADIRGIPPSRRVYVDESFVYDNEAPKRGRGKRGQPIPRVRSRHGKRWTVYAAIRQDGFVHSPIIDSETTDDVNFYHYVWRHLVPNLRPNEVVIWDRLGKAGRCKNPSKQHYNDGDGEEEAKDHENRDGKHNRKDRGAEGENSSDGNTGISSGGSVIGVKTRGDQIPLDYEDFPLEDFTELTLSFLPAGR
ncbi:hypothetical protein DFS34DRAFT_698400 [Phlyctochytrium arcticum]|nr:hypothetical protein DFS34DRAFT_698400 [Phlyctochytrium arcticum]